MESGPVEVSAGSGSSDIRSTATFIVTGEPSMSRSDYAQIRIPSIGIHWTSVSPKRACHLADVGFGLPS